MTCAHKPATRTWKTHSWRSPARTAERRGRLETMNVRTMRQVVVVFRKELKDSLRDSRALFSIGFTIVLGPLLIGFMMNRVADRQREAEQVELPIAGQEHAPTLVEWLRQQSGVQIVAAPANPESAVRERALDVVLIIP